MIPSGTYVVYSHHGSDKPQAIAFFTIDKDGSVKFEDKRSEINLDFMFPHHSQNAMSKHIFDRLINEEDPYRFIRKV